MGLLQRGLNIIGSDINALLEKAEDPEKMLNYLVEQLQDSIKDGQSQVADQLAEEKMIQNDLDQATQNAADWAKKAELAVSKGNDDLAREALKRQADYEGQVKIYQKQFDTQHAADQQLKADLAALQSKYDELVRNKEMLITRAKRAAAQQKIAGVEAKLNPADYSSELARMTRKVETQEAQAAAVEEIQHTVSVDDQFAAMSANDAVEQKLADLKKKMNVPAGS